MADRETFDPKPALYPDSLPGFRARRGLRDEVRRLARAEHVSIAEFLRRAVAERVARAGQGGRDDDPGSSSPSPGIRVAA